ncbi:MAG: hypothetical protein ABL953_07830 [Ilumatobacteraceae bacterium]
MSHLKRTPRVNAWGVKRIGRGVAVVVIVLIGAGVGYAANRVFAGPGGRPVDPIRLDLPQNEADTSIPGSQETLPPDGSIPQTSPPSTPVTDPDDDGGDDDGDDVVDIDDLGDDLVVDGTDDDGDVDDDTDDGDEAD